jgi:hypothetical protein
MTVPLMLVVPFGPWSGARIQTLLSRVRRVAPLCCVQ